jgi:hypothetical protein
MTEEEAFWLLCTLAENLIPEYFDKALLGSIVDQNIFVSLVEKNLVEINEHLNKV